jgi:hypothetical protein
VGAGKFRHPRRSSWPIYVDDGFLLSIYVDDGIFRHPTQVVILRHAFGFCNSVHPVISHEVWAVLLNSIYRDNLSSLQCFSSNTASVFGPTYTLFKFNLISCGLNIALKGQCHEIFHPGFFFIKQSPLGPCHGLKPFRIWLRIRR